MIFGGHFENMQIRSLRHHFSACQHWFLDSAYQITPNHGVRQTWCQEDKQSKVTSSVFPIEMIAKLECIQSNAQQNIEQLQNPTSTTNQQPQNHRLRTDISQSHWGRGGLK